VFCGSAAGAASARKGAYYAGPGNRFWPTLHQIGLTPRLLAPDEFATLPQYGLGLTDMAKHVSGSDASLPRSADDPQAIADKITRIDPDILAFVGKRAAQVFFRHHFHKTRIDYGLQHEALGATALFVLPSTSGLAVRYWDEAPWRTLTGLIKNI
jgi:TDG/mug DNA glycosylase family protein